MYKSNCHDLRFVLVLLAACVAVTYIQFRLSDTTMEQHKTEFGNDTKDSNLHKPYLKKLVTNSNSKSLTRTLLVDAHDNTRPNLEFDFDPKKWFNFKANDEDICRHSKFAEKSHACYGAVVMQKQKVTFCSAAKVASTTIRDFFYQVADGEYVIPEGSRYGVHDINWHRLGELEYETQKEILNDESGSWVNIFFMKNVVERFVSGYLDKVVHECNNMDKLRATEPIAHQPYAAMYHYKKFGFSCDVHQDFETFVDFMEGLEEQNMEGHFFHKQSCVIYGGFHLQISLL